ncbi:hypothetical protein Tco_0335143 [Tanacetum coccineum]
MGDENPIHTLGDYSKPSREGYKNTIELPEGNNVVPLRSDTIRLVQNGCTFHGLRSENPNQHLKERMRMRLFQFSLHDEARNWLERLPAGSISTWENTEESWALLEDLALYDNESWNDPRDFAKPVKAISLPQDVPSTFNRRLIELENQVQLLMEAHLAPKQLVQVNKISSSCQICSGPHDTQYCMENPEQAFVEYASSRTDEAGGKWFTFKPEQNNLGDTYNPSWKSHPNLRWRQPQNSQNNFSNPPNRFQSNGSFPNCPFNNNPQNFNNQSNLEGLVSNFMASQDARLSKFEADFKQQQGEMTNKIDIVLKAITDRIMGAFPCDTVKNPKLNVNSTTPVLSARSYPKEDPQCSNHIHSLINTIKTCSKETNHSQKDQLQTVMEIITQQSHEPERALEDEFQDLYLNLPLLEVLDHAPIYKAILDKYVEILELAKNGSAFVQGKMPAKMEDPGLFTLPCRLRDSKPFDTLADLGSFIDCRKAKIAVGEGIIRSVFGVKETNLGEEEAPYWTTLGKRESYKPRPSSDGVGAIPINLKRNMWESEDSIENPINYYKPPKNRDEAWDAKIRLIDPDGEEFTKTLQLVPTSKKLSEKESPREITNLDHFYDT